MAVFDNVSMSLLPLFGMNEGLDSAAATRVLAVVLLGGVLLQYPFGWLADRSSHRLALALCAGLAVIGSALLKGIILLSGPIKWPLLF